MVESRETRIARRGITLTEVLISMGILAVGLLGVAALFPVGSAYMMKADVADNGSAIGQAVMSDIMTRGVVNPKAWYAMVPAPPGTTRNAWNYSNNAIDGKYLQPKTVQGGTFTRPFAEALADSLAAGNSSAVISQQFGNAFIIDPLFVASATTGNANGNRVAYACPAAEYRLFPRSGTWNYYNTPAWQPWTNPGSNNSQTWPIRRISLQDFANSEWRVGGAMNKDTASLHFRGTDDLVTDLPARTDRPARQNWNLASADLNGNGRLDDPLSRVTAGDYSWMVSVAPQTIAARDGLVRNPESYSYNVSVIVFHKRQLPTEPAGTAGVTAMNNVAQLERTVSAKVLSTGTNGGELLLQAFVTGSGEPADGYTGDPFQDLRSGQWIMLCGPHPNSTASSPQFEMNWYQVLAIEREPNGIITDRRTQRVVSVRGPKWPWLPRASYSNTNSDIAMLSDDLCVGIFRGAVAVHTKTMRLEGPRGGSGAVTGLGGGNNSGGNTGGIVGY